MNQSTTRSMCEMDWPEDVSDIRQAMQTISKLHREQVNLRSAIEIQQEVLSSIIAELDELIAGAFPLSSVFSTGATIRDVLDELLKLGGATAIEKIRFYRYSMSNDDGSYVLVDSAGYDEATADRLRNRGLVFFRSSCPMQCSDTFWADCLGAPTAITVDRHGSTFLQPRYYPGCLPLIVTPHDTCDESLAGAKGQTWIDVPLSVCGKATGKISCDFPFPAAQLKDHHADIMRFCALAQLAAPFLEVLYHRLFVEPVADIVSDIQSCATLHDLFTYCTTTLPRFFNALNASIFTLSTDSFGGAKLVLECTSFASAQPYVGHAAYRLDDAALTAWVARNNRSLRLHDLAEDRERELQLDQYRVFDERLKWEDLVTDSNNHTSYLAVPIPADAERAGGVIRFTEKRTGGDSHFTEQDQARLERIARDAISRRLTVLQAQQGLDVLAYDYVQDANTLLVSNQIPTTPAILASLSTVLGSLFPKSTMDGKAFVVNILTNDCKHFQHFRLGTGLAAEDANEQLFTLNGSLTGCVLRELAKNKTPRKRGRSVVFVNDYNNAQRREAVYQTYGGAETTLACPISFRKKVYGVLIVESECHDLCPESHGRLLELIAAQAGVMFARRDHAYLSKLKAEARTLPPSEVLAWLSSLERTFCSPHAAFNSTPLQQINLRRTVAELARDAGCRRTQISVPDVEVLTHKPPLVDVMYRALKDLCVQSTRPDTVQIRGEVKDKWLELTVEQFFEDADPLEGAAWDREDLDAMFNNADKDPLAWSRKLAYFAQIDSKCGTISQSKLDLVLKFPAG